MHELKISPLPPERFDGLLGQRAAGFVEVLGDSRDALAGRRMWHINSTGRGGGVVEMLEPIVGYLAGGGIDARWAVIDGDEEFFAVTKRLHFMLHGSLGGCGALGPTERAAYEAALSREAGPLSERVRPADIVMLHDPQTLGLAPILKAIGATVIWCCHVGTDEPNESAQEAWRFLWRYVRHPDALGFSRSRYVWEGLDEGRIEVVPPCIDAFSPKNAPLDEATAAAILDSASIVPGVNGRSPTFTRRDGSAGVVRRRASMTQQRPVPPGAPLVAQISRWDPLKDHAGVMLGFAHHVPPGLGAHLLLAGPDPDSIADDPGAAGTFREVHAIWTGLDPSEQARVHLAALPMDDLEENAAMVNALQRRADVIVQKSLAEGFGLTVTEAMWKGRPTVGSRVGGIQDQIVHGDCGLLVDPHSGADFGGAVTTLLTDPMRARKIGEAASDRVLEHYLAPCWLSSYLRIIGDLVVARKLDKG